MNAPWLSQLQQRLAASFLQQRFHHAQLFHGEAGTGKRELANETANALLCANPIELKPCGICKSCQLNVASTHPDKFVIGASEQSIGVDDIRQVSEFMSHSALQNGNKVVVIQQCQLMTTAAANALLKTLEEPSKHRYLLLTCENLSLLPATILSRCNLNEVKVTDTDVVMTWISEQGITAYPWLQNFMQQPLLLQNWHQQQQLETIDSLYKFATELKDSHNFSTLVDILNKDNTLISVFSLFLANNLKHQLAAGMDFYQYQRAQSALTTFVKNSSKVLGLNLSLAITRLAFELRDCK